MSLASPLAIFVNRESELDGVGGWIWSSGCCIADVLGLLGENVAT